jgi:predicted nucleic-acid-binding protein
MDEIMIAVDTNILVRYVTNDDFLQAQQAKKLLSENHVFISKTVILEMEWVLRAVYKLPQANVLKAMLTILGLLNVLVEDMYQIAEAIEYYKGGLDFADALHYVANKQIDTFYTFDEKFIKKSQSLYLKVSGLKP